MKKLFVVLAISLLLFSLIGCDAAKGPEKIPVNVMIPKGTPQVAVISMIKNNPEFEGYEVSYKYPNSNDLLASMFMNREAQIIIAPANLGANIYNKGIDYRLHGVLIWGSLFLVGNEEIGSLSDLDGVEITSTGKGLTTDVLLNYLLRMNGLKDIRIDYKSALSELVPLFMAGETGISLMPEPSLSLLLSKKPDTVIVMDFNSEWKKVTGLDTSYPQASVFIDEEFRKANPGFVEDFLTECLEATAWANNNPEKAGEYYNEIESGFAPSVIASSIPRSSIGYIGAKEAKQSLVKYFEILFEDNPASIGGKMPDEEFYFGQ